MNLYTTFAPFSQRGLPSGVVETCCDRCGQTTLSGLPGRDSLLDAVVWARDHKCPPGRPDTRAGADRRGRPGAEGRSPGTAAAG